MATTKYKWKYGQVRTSKTPLTTGRAWATLWFAFRCSDLCGPTMCAHLQVGLSQILAPDHGRRLRSFSNFSESERRKTLPESGTRHRAWEAQCPFVCTHKRLIFVWIHKTVDLCSSTKMQMSKALSEALHIQDSVNRQQVAATEGG